MFNPFGVVVLAVCPPAAPGVIHIKPLRGFKKQELYSWAKAQTQQIASIRCLKATAIGNNF